MERDPHDLHDAHAISVDLDAARRAILDELADDILAARRMIRMIAWACAFGGVVAALAYYIIAAVNGWRSLK